MPFEISPQFVPAVAPKVGKFQKYAEAMLRGCAMSRPTFGQLLDERLSDWVPWLKPKACALGAIRLGMGMPSAVVPWTDEEQEMLSAYHHRYNTLPIFDNDFRRFTREQIAARIAAL